MEMKDREFALFTDKMKESVKMAGLDCLICLWNREDVERKRAIIICGDSANLLMSLEMLSDEILEAVASK